MPFSSASCLHCLVPCLIPCCLILRCSILVCDALCYPSPLPHLSVASLMLAEQSASFSLFVLHCFPTPLSHSFLTLPFLRLSLLLRSLVSLIQEISLWLFCSMYPLAVPPARRLTWPLHCLSIPMQWPLKLVKCHPSAFNNSP